MAAALLLILAAGWLWSALSGPIEHLIPVHWAGSVLKIIAGIALAFASIAIFISFAALIAGPFNEMLSESIEEHLTGVPGPRFRLSRFVVDLVVGIVHTLRRVLVYLVVMGGLLVLGVVVPVIGTIVATAGGALATARFASYDAYDAIWSRRHWRYRAKIEYLRMNRWRTLGLGAVIALLLVVPGLNLIALSIGATAATLRIVELERSVPRRATDLTRS